MQEDWLLTRRGGGRQRVKVVCTKGGVLGVPFRKMGLWAKGEEAMK